MNPHTHFSTLMHYNVWATQRLLQAIEPVVEADYRRNLGLFFKSIHGTLNHLLVGEHLLWYPRFARGASPKAGSALTLDMEAEPDRARLAQALQGGAANWLPLLEVWPAERFDGTFTYTTTRGNPVTLPFAAALAHVFNHGTHHRGQISAALTQLGQPAPVLDLVYFFQQKTLS